jgi:hypothetical protein
MTLPNRSPPERVRIYMDRSQDYLHNAYESLHHNELEKASEFFWGTMAEAVKAVAAASILELRSHRAIWDYTMRLATEIGDRELWDAFREANSLHGNFYESGLSRDIVLAAGERISESVGRLLAMIPPEVLEQ